MFGTIEGHEGREVRKGTGEAFVGSFMEGPARHYGVSTFSME